MLMGLWDSAQYRTSRDNMKIIDSVTNQHGTIRQGQADAQTVGSRIVSRLQAILCVCFDAAY